MKTTELEFITLDLTELYIAGGVACGSHVVLYDSGEEQRLEDYLSRHPRSARVLRTHGTSLVGKGILPGSLVVVDTAIEPRFGEIALVRIDGDLMLKGYEPPYLISWTPDRQAIPIEPWMMVSVEGVLSSVIIPYHHLR